MPEPTHPGEEERSLILVLPGTFFDQTFLLPHDSSVAGFKVTNCYHFIANVIIEVTASLPENTVMAATSAKAFDAFSGELRKKSFASGAEDLLRVFRNLVVIIPTESMNALGDLESMIALADRLYATSSLSPLVVANQDGLDNFRTAAAKYYGKDPIRFGPQDIPFKILDPVETKGFLQAAYPQESADVLRKTESPFNMF